MTEQTLKQDYAGFWIRFFAHLLDNLFLSVVTWVLDVSFRLLIYQVWKRLSPEEGILPFAEAFDPLFTQILNVGIYLILSFPYYVLFTFYKKGTPGKLLLGIQIVDDSEVTSLTFRQAAIRYLMYLPSYLFFFAGYLMAAVEPRKRALHDWAAGTVCIRKKDSKDAGVPAESTESPLIL